MKIEVEQKFAVEDVEPLRRRLTELGARWEPPVTQCDTYFAHPARDFAATDEALRIRRGSSGTVMTYKGPRLDASTKTRRELELPLAAAAGDAMAELLRALGFSPVADVRKTRTPCVVPWRSEQVEVVLDNVEGLGSFVELEMVVDEAHLDNARALVASLASKLGLSGSERRSYLELLLARK